MADGALFDTIAMQELNSLFEAREAVLTQMMQARAAQSRFGSLEYLSSDIIGDLRRDVLERLADYDLHVDNTQGDLLPESPFEALMILWLAFDADIREIEMRHSDSRLRSQRTDGRSRPIRRTAEIIHPARRTARPVDH